MSNPESVSTKSRGGPERQTMKFLDVPQSGSIAGTTHSHNRAGQYTRNRRAPVQPAGTGRRAFIRSAFGASSTGWASLTSSEQAAFQTYADSHPITDSLGQSIKLTGHQMYVGLSTQLQNVGSTPSGTVPASAIVNAPILLTFTAVASTGVVTVTFDGSGSASDFILLAFGRPQSSGVRQVSAYWQAQFTTADIATAILVGPKIVAQFGALTAGQRLFGKFTPVNQYGVTGVPLKTFITVT